MLTCSGKWPDTFALVTTAFHQIPLAVTGATAVLASRIMIRSAHSVFWATRGRTFVAFHALIVFYAVLASLVRLGAYTIGAWELVTIELDLPFTMVPIFTPTIKTAFVIRVMVHGVEVRGRGCFSRRRRKSA